MVYNSINCSKLHACYIKYITYINIKLILIPDLIHFCYPVTSGNILRTVQKRCISIAVPHFCTTLYFPEVGYYGNTRV